MKRLCALVLAAALMMTMMLVLNSPLCRAQENFYSADNPLFERIGFWKDFTIVYCTETNVMYAVSDGWDVYGNASTMTLLVNPDGTPMLWQKQGG